MPARPRLVALISGGGTTLQNLIDRTATGRLGVEVVGVVSSKAGAFGVERARRAGIPFAIVERGSGRAGGGEGETNALPVSVSPPLPLSPSFPERVWTAVREFNPDLVVLAGWLHLLPIPAEFRHKVLNIHPALLPAFGGKGMYGRHVHEAVLAYGAKVSGCTVHFADDTYDTGPIVVQRSVPVEEGDTPDALAARVFEAECEAYPEAIELVAAGRVRVEGRRVAIAPRG
ncbi:phosphoribosylglycinamide formyltransferase [Gemmata sp.]|uniref:phosphoribosylglycinamide formyltransferase n=1 Tax=Gemmata sp. TaxID=1914242 RepID=UPI003F6E907A